MSSKEVQNKKEARVASKHTHCSFKEGIRSCLKSHKQEPSSNTCRPVGPQMSLTFLSPKNKARSKRRQQSLSAQDYIAEQKISMMDSKVSGKNFEKMVSLRDEMSPQQRKNKPKWVKYFNFPGGNASSASQSMMEKLGNKAALGQRSSLQFNMEATADFSKQGQGAPPDSGLQPANGDELCQISLTITTAPAKQDEEQPSTQVQYEEELVIIEVPEPQLSFMEKKDPQEPAHLESKTRDHTELPYQEYNEQVRQGIKDILCNLNTSQSSSQIIPQVEAPKPQEKPSLEVGQCIRAEEFMASGLQFSFRAQSRLFCDFFELKLEAMVAGFKVRYVMRSKRIRHFICRIKELQKDMASFSQSAGILRDSIQHKQLRLQLRTKKEMMISAVGEILKSSHWFQLVKAKQRPTSRKKQVLRQREKFSKSHFEHTMLSSQGSDPAATQPPTTDCYEPLHFNSNRVSLAKKELLQPGGNEQESKLVSFQNTSRNVSQNRLSVSLRGQQEGSPAHDFTFASKAKKEFLTSMRSNEEKQEVTEYVVTDNSSAAIATLECQKGKFQKELEQFSRLRQERSASKTPAGANQSVLSESPKARHSNVLTPPQQTKAKLERETQRKKGFEFPQQETTRNRKNDSQLQNFNKKHNFQFTNQAQKQDSSATVSKVNFDQDSVQQDYSHEGRFKIAKAQTFGLSKVVRNLQNQSSFSAAAQQEGPDKGRKAEQLDTKYYKQLKNKYAKVDRRVDCWQHPQVKQQKSQGEDLRQSLQVEEPKTGSKTRSPLFSPAKNQLQVSRSAEYVTFQKPMGGRK